MTATATYSGDLPALPMGEGTSGELCDRFGGGIPTRAIWQPIACF